MTEQIFDPGIDTTVKSLSDDGLRIGGYAVIFGNANQRDLTNEYFTKATNFELGWFDKRPVLYHHGFDTMLKTAPIGVIDKLTVDETGVWAEAQLDKHNKYVGKVKDLVAKGALGWSSGSMSHLVTKADGGEITRWPLIEASLTPTPAEPRGTWVSPMKAHEADEYDTVLMAYKALNIDPANLAIPQPPAPVSAQESAPVTVETEAPDIAPSKSSNEEFEMTPEQMSELAQKSAEQAVKAYIAQHPAPTEPAPVAPTKSLPQSSALPIEQEATKTDRIVVGNERRYADYNADAMVFEREWMTQLARENADKPLINRAKRFVAELQNPQNRFDRQLAAKMFLEAKDGKLNEHVFEDLPIKSLNEAYSASFKANELVNDGQSGYGAESKWQSWSQEPWRRLRIANPMLQNLPIQQLPSNDWIQEVESTDPIFQYIPEATDVSQMVLNASNTITMSKIGTAKISWSAKKVGVRLGYSMEWGEDTIAYRVPLAADQARRTVQDGIDSNIINGDTATGANNLNLIDGTPSSTAGYLAVNGILKNAIITNTGLAVSAGGGTPTLSMFRSIRFKMTTYAMDIPNLMFVVDTQTYSKMLSMPEYATWQNAGVQASNLTGMLPNGNPNQYQQVAYPVGLIDGIPVYVSAQMGLANTSGKISNTGSNNTLGRALIVHKNRWKVGMRRDIQFVAMELPLHSDTNLIQVTARMDLQVFDTASCGVLYNISVT